MTWLPIVFVSGGIIILLATLIGRQVWESYNTQSKLAREGEVEGSEAENIQKTVVVDVAGAVEKPGVYRLPDDSRISDVLITAGGLNPKANRNYIAKNINLAQKISDGQKIYFPFEGELESPIISGQNTSNQTKEPVNINSASLSQLDQLPGVGPVTAGKIISGRPFQKLEDLVTSKVMSRSTFEKIKTQITL